VTNSTFISMDSSSKRFNLKIRVSHSTSVRHYAYRYHDGTLQYKEQKDDIVTKSFFGIKIGRKNNNCETTLQQTDANSFNFQSWPGLKCLRSTMMPCSSLTSISRQNQPPHFIQCNFFNWQIRFLPKLSVLLLGRNFDDSRLVDDPSGPVAFLHDADDPGLVALLLLNILKKQFWLF